MREYHALLRSTSRTFAAGIEALPRGLRDAVTLAYLVLRVSDYYEDSPTLTAYEKRRCLDCWGDLVGQAGGPIDGAALEPLVAGVSQKDRGLPDRLAAQEARAILAGLAELPERFLEPIRRHTSATTEGMSRWAGLGDAFPDEAALDDYMFEVAGRVGLLLTELFSAHSRGVLAREEELGRLAVSFGLGLQTVNVIRGLHEDPGRGWNYVPRTLLPPGGGTVELRGLAAEDQVRILEFLARKAGRHLADGLQYCQIVPRRERGIRIFCIIPALLALRTARLSRRDVRVFTDPVKVSRKEVGRVVTLSRVLYFSDSWLAAERRGALALADGSASD